VTKKILVIDVEKLVDKFCYYTTKEYQSIMRSSVLKNIEESELKDVVEFEATVICQEKTLGAGKFINAKIPDNLDVKNGEKLHVLAVKQKKLPSFADMKGIFRKKEEP